MHQIRFRLGLRPRPRWVSSQHSLDHIDFIRGLIFEEREERGRGENQGREGRGKKGKKKEGGTKGGKRRGKGRRCPSQLKFLVSPLPN